MTRWNESDLSRRLAELRVPPPETGFEASLMAALAAEALGGARSSAWVRWARRIGMGAGIAALPLAAAAAVGGGLVNLPWVERTSPPGGDTQVMAERALNAPRRTPEPIGRAVLTTTAPESAAHPSPMRPPPETGRELAHVANGWSRRGSPRAEAAPMAGKVSPLAEGEQATPVHHPGEAPTRTGDSSSGSQSRLEGTVAAAEERVEGAGRPDPAESSLDRSSPPGRLRVGRVSLQAGPDEDPRRAGPPRSVGNAEPPAAEAADDATGHRGSADRGAKARADRSHREARTRQEGARERRQQAGDAARERRQQGGGERGR